ncbi:MAG: tRNA pseudouridine(55) synthase TruB [Flavobacteriales bacterium]|nr:tRNA pseudouridine(55) synthase TruB [Flavobacteriales bacterium]|tara:strand:- start:614 stop:1312 length:699 start_codon:yes stop_codon:yes gene_type:complete
MIEPVTKINSDLDYIEGCLILVNKPIGWTSFDVVKKIRSFIKKTCNLKKIKVGHAGTLDPLAEGLLIICTGKLTKRISEIQKLKKKYCGEMKLGASTPSYDRETYENQIYPISHINPEIIRNNVDNFLGMIYQKPPMFSAIKKNGVRLYKLARKNINLNIDPREIQIHNFHITNIKIPHVMFEVECSSGTYIRTLVHDFGKKIDSGSYLTSLKRTQIGDYKLSNSLTMKDFL